MSKRGKHGSPDVCSGLLLLLPPALVRSGWQELARRLAYVHKMQYMPPRLLVDTPPHTPLCTPSSCIHPRRLTAYFLETLRYAAKADPGTPYPGIELSLASIDDQAVTHLTHLTHLEQGRGSILSVSHRNTLFNSTHPFRTLLYQAPFPFLPIHPFTHLPALPYHAPPFFLRNHSFHTELRAPDAPTLRTRIAAAVVDFVSKTTTPLTSKPVHDSRTLPKLFTLASNYTIGKIPTHQLRSRADPLPSNLLPKADLYIISTRRTILEASSKSGVDTCANCCQL